MSRTTLARLLLSALTASLAYPPVAAARFAAEGSSRAAAFQTLIAGMHGGNAPGAEEKCGLSALMFALAHRSTLSPSLQEALRAVMSRQDREVRRVDGRFCVHYDTSATSENTPALLDSLHRRIPGTADRFVDSVFSYLGRVVHVEVDSLGYPFPPSDGTLGGGPEYDIYIEGNINAYGFTDIDGSIPDGGTATTFMTIDRDFSFVTPDSNKGLPGLQVTLAHEFHHAIQIGRYGLWFDDSYFYELTSVWLEDVVFTHVNDYLNYLKAGWGQFRNPDVPLTSNDNIKYSRGIWGTFIAKRFGADAMKKIWEAIRSERPLPAMDATLRLPEYESSLPAAFAEWSLWNAFTGPRSDPVAYYPEGNLFPTVTTSPVVFSPPARNVDGTLPNLSSRYYEISSSADTLTLVVANLDVASALTDNAYAPRQYPFTVALAQRKADEAYRATAAAVYYKLVPAGEPSNWWTWNIVRGVVGAPPTEEGAPFPNPFIANGANSLFIQASAPDGTLSIYSSAMDRIYSAYQTTQLYFGKHVFLWNGVTDRNVPASSGVYFYVLSLPDRTVRGKFALIRR